MVIKYRFNSKKYMIHGHRRCVLNIFCNHQVREARWWCRNEQLCNFNFLKQQRIFFLLMCHVHWKWTGGSVPCHLQSRTQSVRIMYPCNIANLHGKRKNTWQSSLINSWNIVGTSVHMTWAELQRMKEYNLNMCLEGEN